MQALVDKLKREQAIAAATHAYPALSCPVRHVVVSLINTHEVLRLKGLQARRSGYRALPCSGYQCGDKLQCIPSVCLQWLSASAQVCFEDFEDAAAPQPPPSAPPLPAEGFRDPAGRSSGAPEASGPSKAEDERECEAAPVSDAELCSPLLPPLGSQHSG